MTIICPKCGSSARIGARFCASCGAALTMSARQLQAGQELRNRDYRIVRPLSKGGMGVIYLAENLQAFGRLCAIKEMLDYFDPTDPQQVASAQKRFEDEARTLAQLRHPGIPEILAYFSEGGRNFIVMEYVEGTSLDTAVSRIDASGRRVAGQRLSLAQIVRYGEQVCEILEYLTDLSPPVVHHDIKPANIIVNKSTGRACLVDFGTAKARLTRQPGGQVGLQKSSIYGTEGYAPPEQYQGQSEPRSDVYALAAALYHLLTDDDPGDHPFQFPKLGGFPLGLGPILARALERDVNRRITARELRQALIASLSSTTPPQQPKAKRAKPSAHQSYAIVASQGVPDAVRPAVVQYLQSQLGLSAVNAEIITWQVAASIGRGLDLKQAVSLEKDLQALGVQVQRVPTSQLLTWRLGISNPDPRLVADGEMKAFLSDIPPDRICHCYRCGHEWTTSARSVHTLPSRCRRCKSPQWRQYRLFQCAICGHQFAHGDLSAPARSLFPQCLACHTQMWHPKQQPRLQHSSLFVDAGSVLIGKKTPVPIQLHPVSGSPGLRGRVTSNVPWLQVAQSEFAGDRFQVLVDPTGMPTKQTHTGSINVICNAGQVRVEVKVYVDEPPRLAISSSSMDFGVLNVKEERTLKLVLFNAGGQSLKGAVTSVPGWLRLNRSDFEGDQTELQLTAYGRELPVAGLNKATLTIDSNGGRVMVDVLATALPTTLAVQPTDLDFGYRPQGKRVRRTLTLTNLGVGTLQGRIVADQPWLTVDPSDFRGNRVETSVTANTEGLVPSGTFHAQLTIVSNGGNTVIPAKVEVSPYRWLRHTLYRSRWWLVASGILLLVWLPIVCFAVWYWAPVGELARAPGTTGQPFAIPPVTFTPTASAPPTSVPSHIEMPSPEPVEIPPTGLTPMHAWPPTRTPPHVATPELASVSGSTPVKTPTHTRVPVEMPADVSSPTQELTATRLSTPTPSPSPSPTSTSIPVMAPSCPDPRAVITSPGVNQIISGVVEISGTAVHEQFQYYKVEYAPGAQADAGFVYISGSDRPVLNGRLVSFDSRTVPNGTYTLRLTTIDQTGNYPPPCQVTVTVRN